jgi:hypothetical protein
MRLFGRDYVCVYNMCECVCVCIIYPIDKHVLFFSNRLLEGLPTHRKLPLLQRAGSSVTKNTLYR